jgi:hypothetical protein
MQLPSRKLEQEQRETTYHPKQKENQQISARNSCTLWEVIRNALVPIAEDTTHENRCDTPSIVRLRGEIDNRDYGSYKDIQTGSSHTSSSADIDREAEKVFNSAAAVKYHENRENG